jgi:predicted nuclease of predicted toxin-antitoxin system
MAAPLFMLDENLSPETVKVLQERGYSAVWLTEFVQLGATDTEIARAAVEANAIIVTQDLDFAEMFFFNSGYSVGTIVLRLRIQTVERVNERLLNFLKSMREQQVDLANALFIIEDSRYRVRK